jgi:hypothetical protein
VHVQKVERVVLGHLRHLGGQGQGVRGIVKEGIGHHFHFVVANASRHVRHFVQLGQANGLGVADEVDFMTASGELHAEFGGHDSAAAVGGIAGDANFHGRSNLAERFRRRQPSR